MSTIIKSADRTRGGESAPFNFDDMRSQADRYLAQMREQAGQMLLEAKREADAIRARAEVEGRRAGEAQIDQKVAQQLQTALKTLTPALQTAIHEVQQARLADWEQNVVRLSCAIAERLVRRELSASPQITFTWIREALELAAGQGRVRLSLNPQDHATLAPQLPATIANWARLAPTEIVADPQVTRGGCRVETELSSIDQRLETQLARIEQELS